MSIHNTRLEEAVTMARLSQEHASDLARNMIRDWVREGSKEISASTEISLSAAAAAGSHLLFDTVELLCKALDTDAVGLVRKANNELRSCRTGNLLEIVVVCSWGRPYLKFAVRAAQPARS